MTFEQLKAEWENDSPYIVCHTSGSTGTPKSIRLPKNEMLNSARRTSEFFNLSPSSHLHSCVAADFIGGKMMLVRAILNRCVFTCEKPSNRPLENYSGRDIDLLSVVPSQLIHILNNPEHLPVIHNILVGGAPLMPDLKERIILSGIPVYESYGMTETSSHIALRKVEEGKDFFQTLPGIKVFDAGDSCLGISIEGWMDFITNDIAQIKNDTEFKILGRIDNVIISGGLKIHPETLENRLSPAFSFPFFITSRPDSKWGERVVIAVAGITPSDEKITETCRSLLLPHEVPKEVVRLKEIPLTSNGKIKRCKL